MGSLFTQVERDRPVRLALTVALEAVNHASVPAEELATVFGSSNGSGLEIHKILEAVSTPEMLVSPTHFHNSVHNSSVGYWCIATGCHQPSTSIVRRIPESSTSRSSTAL